MYLLSFRNIYFFRHPALWRKMQDPTMFMQLVASFQAQKPDSAGNSPLRDGPYVISNTGSKPVSIHASPISFVGMR
jgi:hypothetical protein